MLRGLFKILTFLVPLIFLAQGLGALPARAGGLFSEPAQATVFQRGPRGSADVPYALTPGWGQARVVLSRHGENRPLAAHVVRPGGYPSFFRRVPPGLYDLRATALDLSGHRQSDRRLIGVGEVFLVAGQSNAVSTDQNPENNKHYSATGLVSVNDYYRELSGDKTTPGEPEAQTLVFTGPRLSLTANVCWMRLGDLLAQKYHMPIGFVNVARNATNTNCWNPQGGPCWPLLAKVLASRPFRAVLWHQGESDAMDHFTRERTEANMAAMITASRAIAPGIPWFVAHNSLKTDVAYANQPVRLAQTWVVESGLACAGPDTDPIREHPGWVGAADFDRGGLIRHGELWFAVIDAFLTRGQCRQAFSQSP